MPCRGTLAGSPPHAQGMRVAIVTESFLPQISGVTNSVGRRMARNARASVQGRSWEVIGRELTAHYKEVA